MNERELREALSRVQKPEPPSFFAARVARIATSRPSRKGLIVGYTAAAAGASVAILNQADWSWNALVLLAPLAIGAVAFPEFRRGVAALFIPLLR